MNEELQTFLTATIALDVLLLVGLALTILRGAGDPAPSARRRTALVGSIAVAVQSIHFIEEWKSSFHESFPELLGLQPFSESLFVSFNVTWIGIWIVSLFGIRLGVHAALFPLWFLAVASAFNGVAHPFLAMAAEGGFPGLWTSPLSGVAGVMLLRELVRFTASRRTELKAA